MVEYKIPEEIKTRLNKEVMSGFLDNLKRIFKLDDNKANEELPYLISSVGWGMAFNNICRDYLLFDVSDYYLKLDWYDSDLFDDELLELLYEYKLIKR